MDTLRADFTSRTIAYLKRTYPMLKDVRVALKNQGSKNYSIKIRARFMRYWLTVEKTADAPQGSLHKALEALRHRMAKTRDKMKRAPHRRELAFFQSNDISY
jgi:ribosome-associated translation inhibitor RaiA